MRFWDIVLSAAQGEGTAADPYGPELWPQPDFASDAGLTLDGGGDTAPVVSGGTLTFPDEGDPAVCTATALDTLTAGNYHYEAALTANPASSINMALNDGATNSDAFIGTGIFTGTINLPSAETQTISLKSSFNAAVVSHFSLKRIL